MNETTVSSLIVNTTADSIIGYVAMLISCAAFGTMFVPLKKVDCRDGFFVQWVECGVVFITGFIINIIRGFPKFEWVVAIGGLLYATGNVFSVPIVGGLGMGLGLLIWGTMQTLVGWSVARFGLFGWLAATEPAYAWLNYIGLALTIASGILFVFVKPKTGEEAQIEEEKAASDRDSFNEPPQSVQRSQLATEMIRKLPYIFMAMGLAVLHGFMMSPIDIMKQKHPSSDKYRVFDYCFSFYASVFFFSTIYFFLYCIVMRQKAYIQRELVIPSIGYGILWTTGMTLWFLAGDKLSQVIAYPVTTRLPAIIGALLEVFLYKTIVGRKNLMVLAVSIGIGVCGVITIALSNQHF